MPNPEFSTVNSEAAPGLDEYYEESDQITQGSETIEEFYRTQAIEQKGGLNVEITRINLDCKYYIQAVVYVSSRMSSYKVKTITEDPVETLSDINITELPSENIYQLFTVMRPSLTVYFKTPYGKTFKDTIEPDISSRKDPTRQVFKDLATELKRADFESINDVSPLDTLPTKVQVDDTVEEGVLEIGPNVVRLEAEEVECPVQEQSNSRLETFISTDMDIAYSGYTDWYWGYISELREQEDCNKVGIVVQTPLHKTVFFFDLNCNTQNGLWKLVEKKGGTLQDIRGMDVCVRERSQRVREFIGSNFVYRLNTQNPVQSPPLDHEASPFSLDNNSSTNHMLDYDDSNDITPIGVDINYMWDLGIPPQNRFESERESGNGSLIDRVTSYLSR